MERVIPSVPYEELLTQEEEWEARGDQVEVSDKQAWLEEGKNIYTQLIAYHPREQRFQIALALIYLDLGRDKKVRHGNYLEAEKLLKKVTVYHSNHPQAYFHLSFIAYQKKKWEEGVFYGEKAISRGLQGTRKIKLLINLAKCHGKLRYIEEAEQLIEQARKLDSDYEQITLIEYALNEIREDRRHLSPFIFVSTQGEKKYLSRQEVVKLREDVLEEKKHIILLDLI